jgi:hypothetical protein
VFCKFERIANMYETFDASDFMVVGHPHRRSNVTLERLAMEELPIGKAICFPKGKVPKGSISGWSGSIGKERGVSFSILDRGDNWVVVCKQRTA